MSYYTFSLKKGKFELSVVSTDEGFILNQYSKMSSEYFNDKPEKSKEKDKTKTEPEAENEKAAKKAETKVAAAKPKAAEEKKPVKEEVKIPEVETAKEAEEPVNETKPVELEKEAVVDEEEETSEPEILKETAKARKSGSFPDLIEASPKKEGAKVDEAAEPEAKKETAPVVEPDKKEEEKNILDVDIEKEVDKQFPLEEKKPAGEELKVSESETLENTEEKLKTEIEEVAEKVELQEVKAKEPEAGNDLVEGVMSEAEIKMILNENKKNEPEIQESDEQEEEMAEAEVSDEEPEKSDVETVEKKEDEKVSDEEDKFKKIFEQKLQDESLDRPPEPQENINPDEDNANEEGSANLAKILDEKFRDKASEGNISPEEILKTIKENKKEVFQEPEKTAGESSKSVAYDALSGLPDMVQEKLNNSDKSEKTYDLKFNSLEDLIYLKKPENNIDYLLLTAMFIEKNEQVEKYSLKQINSKVLKLIKKPLDHSVIHDAVASDYLEVVPDYTGKADVTEYKITSKGEDYILNEL